MITEAVAGRFRVTGINSAIAAAEPIPGRTPMACPKMQPMKRNNKFIGWNTACIPFRRKFRVSMAKVQSLKARRLSLEEVQRRET
jgi:hypothetical protein